MLTGTYKRFIQRLFVCRELNCVTVCMYVCLVSVCVCVCVCVCV